MMSYTGVMLFLSPKGRVAYWTGWKLLGLGKDQYSELHSTFMVLFLVAGIWHVVLNWKPITTYLKNKARELRIFTREFNLALGLCLLFALGTLAGWPPWGTYLGLGESIKDFWERRDGSPPWGHAEENSLARFARGLSDWERVEHERQVTLSPERAVTTLREAGLEVASEQQRLIEIAEANGTTPQRLMDLLREAAQPLPEGQRTAARDEEEAGPFPLPLSGLGRMTLRSYSERYEVDLERLIELLDGEDPVDPDQRIRELALSRDTDPQGLIEELNQRAFDDDQ